MLTQTLSNLGPYALLAIGAVIGTFACALIMLKRDGKSKADKAAQVVTWFLKFLRPVVGDNRVAEITVIISGVLHKAAANDQPRQDELVKMVEEQAAANNVQITPNEMAAIMLMVNLALDDKHANAAFQAKSAGFVVASIAARAFTVESKE